MQVRNKPLHHQKDKWQSDDHYYPCGSPMRNKRQVLEYASQREKRTQAMKGLQQRNDKPTQAHEEQCRPQRRNEKRTQEQKDHYRPQTRNEKRAQEQKEQDKTTTDKRETSTCTNRTIQTTEKPNVVIIRTKTKRTLKRGKGRTTSNAKGGQKIEANKKLS